VPAPRPLRWNNDAQRELTTALASASSWRTALKDATRVVGSAAGWDMSIAWCMDERGGRYACNAMWMRNPDELAAFETATWQRPQSASGSEVGRVALGGQSAWVGDLGRTSDPHLASAAEHGMRAAMLLPLRHGGETVGVLELCTGLDTEIDADLSAALDAVATQLAHYEHLLRLGEAPRWRTGRL
jgi:GAF domain-containing protein